MATALAPLGLTPSWLIVALVIWDSSEVEGAQSI